MDANKLKTFFAPFAAVAVKGMFGGRGVHAGELMIALQAGGEIYLKTDEISRPRFAEAGSSPYIYPTPMGPRETSYWRLPAAARDDTEALKRWCGVALEAASRAAAAKAAKSVKRSKSGKPAKAASRGKAAPAKRKTASRSSPRKAAKPARRGGGKAR